MSAALWLRNTFQISVQATKSADVLNDNLITFLYKY